jgi:predicted MFS family arabinose efflux permease
MSHRIRTVLEPLLPVGRFDKNARRFVAIMWLAGLIQGFAQSQASATLPFTRVGLGLSEGEMSLLLGFARLAAFGALPLGWLGDHVGRRRPFLWALTIVVVAGTVSGFAMDAWHFGLAQAFLRVGTAAVAGLAVVIIAEQVPAEIRAYSISFYGAAVSLGAGAALATLPLAELGPDAWRIPHLLIAVGLLALPFLIRAIPESEVYERAEHDGHWRDLIAGSHRRNFWIVGAVGFLASMFTSVAIAFSTERLIQGVGLSSGATVWVSLLGGTVGGIGFFIGGHLADSWGRRLTTVLSIVMAMAGGVLLYNTSTLPLILVAVVVSSFGTFAFVPAGGSHRAELFPTHLRSSATTAASNLAIAGSAVGLISGVYTIDRFGLSATITMLSVLMLVSAAATLALPETRGQDLTAPVTDRR